MSCSSYCQGLQSCLEPARLVEPRVLRLILAPSKSNTNHCSPARSSKSFIADSKSDGDSNSNNNDNVDVGGGWSFLQALATNNINSKTNKQDDSEKDKDVYTPPNFKRSSSMLSAKSLEMCTESLGSETGSDGSESSDEKALFCSENVKIETRQQRSRLRETRMTRTASFPPPLTSISGSTNVKVKSHREGGRLVLEAVSVSSCQTYFHAERIDGRLRLHLMKDGSDDEEEQNEEEEETLVEEAEDGDWEEAENGGNCGGEMGMERLPRPSRCKESDSGNKSLINWEPFWVAT